MKHVAIGMLGVAVLALCACGSDDSNAVVITADAGNAAVLSVSPSPMALRVGDSKQLKAEVVRADGSTADVSSDTGTVWKSDDPATATVDASGNVLGVKGGQTNVSASFGGATRSVLVTVVP